MKPLTLPDGEKIRPLLLEKKLQDQREAGIDFDYNLEQRKRSWAAMEKALAAGKVKMIGVANYPAPLIAEMDTYANVMPAMNQLEFNPGFASPAVQEACNKRGIKLTAYGTCSSTLMEKNEIITAIAAKMNLSPVQTVIRWTVQKGVVAIPSSQNSARRSHNLASLDGPDLSAEDMAAIDGLHRNHPYYWLPEATLATCNYKGE